MQPTDTTNQNELQELAEEKIANLLAAAEQLKKEITATSTMQATYLAELDQTVDQAADRLEAGQTELAAAETDATKELDILILSTVEEIANNPDQEMVEEFEESVGL